VNGKALDPEAGDLAVNIGWGHFGKESAIMPGQGTAIERNYTPDESNLIADGAKALGFLPSQVTELLGETTYDIYLNDVAYWKNIPAKIWDYSIGGYQVIKKWLSYREQDILDRSLTREEAREVMNVARRIAAILLLTPSLDANYEAMRQTLL
jgi:Type ISP C-terminal specificity domain